MNSGATLIIVRRNILFRPLAECLVGWRASGALSAVQKPRPNPLRRAPDEPS